MVLFVPDKNLPLRYVHRFEKRVGGAESNVAIALVRFGHSVGWISRVGDDEFGRFLLSSIRGEGVDVSQVKVDPGAPTGIYFKERRGPGREKVYYYRSNSAASRIQPSDLDPDYLKSARFIHLTGITPALSASCRRAVFEALKTARDAGVTVSFDFNIRLPLWKGEETRDMLLEIARKSDLVFINHQEAEILFGTREPEEVLPRLLEGRCCTAIMKLGAQGAVAKTHEEEVFEPARRVEEIVDTVGAGDSFAAGVLAGKLRGYALADCLKLANTTAAMVLGTEGDYESLPRSFEEVVSLAFGGRK